MAFRADVLFEIFLCVFQKFDHGEVVDDWVPVWWDLRPGDTLEYEAGCDISGMAEVVTVTDETTEEERDGEKVWMVRCTFRKLS